MAEAAEIREKRYAIEESGAGRKLSKSQSAQVAQFKIMEKKAKNNARAAAASDAELQAKRDAPPPSFGLPKLPF